MVAFDYAAAKLHIVDGFNGWKCPPGDEVAFGKATRVLVHDRQLRQKLRRAARATAEKLTWKDIVGGIEETLKRLAEPPDDRGTARRAGTSPRSSSISGSRASSATVSPRS